MCAFIPFISGSSSGSGLVEYYLSSPLVTITSHLDTSNMVASWS
jgi:hypothetical protein